MFVIPECKAAGTDDGEADEAVAKILNNLNGGDSFAVIHTANSWGGGYSMDVIRKVANAFAVKGYWVYLCTGPCYSSPNQLFVCTDDRLEGERGFRRVMP